MIFYVGFKKKMSFCFNFSPICQDGRKTYFQYNTLELPNAKRGKIEKRMKFFSQIIIGKSHVSGQDFDNRLL